MSKTTFIHLITKYCLHSNTSHQSYHTFTLLLSYCNHTRVRATKREKVLHPDNVLLEVRNIDTEELQQRIRVDHEVRIEIHHGEVDLLAYLLS